MSDPDRPASQSSRQAKGLAMQRFRQWGARNLIKVTNPGEIRSDVQGYIGNMQAIAGQTPREISRTLGLRETDLASGAMIYRLDRIPHEHEFEVRGMTTLVDGKVLPDGQTQNAAGYRAGTGAFQYEISRNAAIPATLLGRLGARRNVRSAHDPGSGRFGDNLQRGRMVARQPAQISEQR